MGRKASRLKVEVFLLLKGVYNGGYKGSIRVL